jgi:WD40 repeat protein
MRTVVPRRVFLGGILGLNAGVLSACGQTVVAVVSTPVATVGDVAPATGAFNVTPAWTQPGGSGTVETLAWRPGQQQFATGSSDGQVRLRSSAGMVQQTIPFAGFVSGLSWSPDGAILAVATTHGSLLFWPGHGAWPTSIGTVVNRYAGVAWRPDGGVLAVAGGEGSVTLWQPTGTPGPTLAISGQTTALAWSPDGALLAAGNRTGEVHVWTAAGGQHWLTAAANRRDVNSLAWSPDGRLLAAGYEDGSVALLTADAGREQGSLPVGRPVNTVTWSPNGAILAVSSLRLSVTLWSAVPPAPLTELPVGYDVNGLLWSPAGDLLLAGADDHALHAWSVQPAQGPGSPMLSATGFMAR